MWNVLSQHLPQLLFHLPQIRCLAGEGGTRDLAQAWKQLLTSRIDKVEQTMTDMRTDLTGLHNAIVARIGEYDKTLMDVGTEIKAMEKVFQKVLPELTGNIQELSRITKNVKGK